MLVGDVRTAGNVVVPHAEDFLGELERVMAKFGVVKLDVSVVAPVQRADNSTILSCQHWGGDGASCVWADGECNVEPCAPMARHQ